MFTKYGYFTIGISLIVSFLLFAVAVFSHNTIVKAIFIIVPILLVIFTLNFFRDPERVTPTGDNLVISPADGKVIVIKDVIENKFINGKGKQISVFMSPLNVHVNRIPISGKVDYVKYVPGKFIAAFEDKASEENERSEFGITSKYGKVFFTQVAGFVARRIVYDLKGNESVIAGERFGMIKFGSRVDIIVPENATIKVKKDDVVRAGETILFEFNEGK